MAASSREQRRTHLLSFLRSIQKPGLPIGDLAESDQLVASGLIDSLAVLEVVSYLESTYAIDFALHGFDAEQFSSIGAILDLVEQSVPASGPGESAPAAAAPSAP